jgi:hypothetical protein
MPKTEHLLYNGACKLEFDTGKHIYLINGQRAVGVTTVTGLIDKSGVLMGWVAKGISEHLKTRLRPGVALDEVEIKSLAEDVKKIHRQRSKSAADLGTMAHEWAEKYVKSKLGLCDLPAILVNPTLQNCAKAFLSWEAGHGVKWVSAERKVASLKHNFAGTQDFSAVISLCGQKCCGEEKATDVLICGDWKTSNNIYPEYFIQTGAYWGACAEEDGLEAKMRVIVRFGKESGEFEAKVAKDNKDDYGAFLGLLEAHRRLSTIKAAWDA